MQVHLIHAHLEAFVLEKGLSSTFTLKHKHSISSNLKKGLQILENMCLKHTHSSACPISAKHCRTVFNSVYIYMYVCCVHIPVTRLLFITITIVILKVNIITMYTTGNFQDLKYCHMQSYITWKQ